MIKAAQWVHIDIHPTVTPTAPLAWDENKLSLKFKISFENVGVGPAINVVARGRDINEMLGDDSVQSIEELKGICKAMSVTFGQTIKPRETKELPIKVEIRRDRAEVILNGRGDFPSIGMMFVMCCVYYQTPYPIEGIFKRFAFVVMKENGEFGAPILPSDIPLSADQIVIRRAMSDGPNVLGANVEPT